MDVRILWKRADGGDFDHPLWGMWRVLYPIALEVLLRGLAIQDSAFWKFLSDARGDLAIFGECIQTLFCEVLRRDGVGFGSPDEVPPRLTRAARAARAPSKPGRTGRA